MPRYLISFDDGAMDHIPDEDWPEVGESSHAVVQEAKDAAVWVFGGGVEHQRATIVGTDGQVTDGPFPEPWRVTLPRLGVVRVREAGVEPARPKAPDPKSGVAAVTPLPRCSGV